VVISRSTGQISSANSKSLTTNFGFDALRAPWRVALDYQWFKDPRAKSYLDRLSFFSAEWKAKGKIGSSYSHDGTVITASESPSMYGGLIGYFDIVDPSLGNAVYSQKLKSLFDSDTNALKVELGYYDSNWAWLGMGIHSGLLPNLYQSAK